MQQTELQIELQIEQIELHKKWTYNKGDSQTSRYKITLDGLTCR